MLSVKPLFITFSCLAFVVAGCDSQGELTTNPGNGQIELVQPLPSITMVDSDTARIALNSYFRYNGGQSLSYTHTVVGTALLLPSIDNTDVAIGPQLLLIPRENNFGDGNAQVIVTASIGGNSQLSDTLGVTIVDDCPGTPDSGFVDYFPIEFPLVWEFDYRAEGSSSSTGYPMETLSIGTFTYRIDEGPSVGYCTDFTRRHVATEIKQWDYQWRVFTENGWTEWSEPEPFQTTQQTELFERGSTIISFFNQGDENNPTQRYWEASSPDQVTVEGNIYGTSCPPFSQLILQRGIGPVYFSKYCYINSTGSLFEQVYTRR